MPKRHSNPGVDDFPANFSAAQPFLTRNVHCLGDYILSRQQLIAERPAYKVYPGPLDKTIRPEDIANGGLLAIRGRAGYRWA